MSKLDHGNALVNVPPEPVPYYVRLGLTSQQSEFVAEFVRNGGNATAAARAAGYKSPATSGYDQKNNPKIASAIRRHMRATIGTEGVRLAWGVYETILKSDDASLALKQKCAKHVLDLALNMDQSGDREIGTPNGKRVEEMTLAELQRFIGAAQDTLAWIKVVDGEATDNAA